MAEAEHRPRPDLAERLDLDFEIPHSARVHNYRLGGKDNVEADRAAGDAVLEVRGSRRRSGSPGSSSSGWCAASPARHRFRRGPLDRRSNDGSHPARQFLALEDSTTTSAEVREGAENYARAGAIPYNLRSSEQLAELFTGLDMVDPGLVPVSRWRPNPAEVGTVTFIDKYGAVARKG